MKHITKNESVDEIDFEDSINEDDYILILDSSGNLKTVVMPEDNDDNDLPENVTNVLNIFGINGLGSQYLH